MNSEAFAGGMLMKSVKPFTLGTYKVCPSTIGNASRKAREDLDSNTLKQGVFPSMIWAKTLSASYSAMFEEDSLPVWAA